MKSSLMVFCLMVVLPGTLLACPPGSTLVGNGRFCIPTAESMLEAHIQEIEKSFPKDAANADFYRCRIANTYNQTPSPNAGQVARLDALQKKLDKTFPLPADSEMVTSKDGLLTCSVRKKQPPEDPKVEDKDSTPLVSQNGF